jgi:hypothetical protein
MPFARTLRLGLLLLAACTCDVATSGGGGGGSAGTGGGTGQTGTGGNGVGGSATGGSGGNGGSSSSGGGTSAGGGTSSGGGSGQCPTPGNELAALHTAEQALPAHDPSKSLDVVNPDRGVCAIRGGAGLFFAPLAFHTQADCQSLCATFTSNPNRTCEWKGQVFFGDPTQSCLVQGGAFATLSSLPSATLSQCRAACDSFANVNRTCEWGTDRIQHPARGNECRILSGQGTNLQMVFATQGDCQTLCDGSSDAYRRCTWGNVVLKAPDPMTKCEIWGGAGVVLAPVFYSAMSDCVSACASFATSNPARFCFYGTTRLP